MSPSRVFPSSIPIRRSLGRKGIVTTVLDGKNYYVDFGRGEAELSVLLSPSRLNLQDVVRGWLSAEGDVWRIKQGKYPLVVMYAAGAFLSANGTIVPWASPGIGVNQPGGLISSGNLENHFWVLEDGSGYLVNDHQVNWNPDIQYALVHSYRFEDGEPHEAVNSSDFSTFSVDRAIWAWSAGTGGDGNSNHYRNRMFATLGPRNQGTEAFDATDGSGRSTLVAVRVLPDGTFGPELRYFGSPFEPDVGGVAEPDGESMHWHPAMTHILVGAGHPIEFDPNTDTFGGDVGLPPGYVAPTPLSTYRQRRAYWSGDGQGAIFSAANGANHKIKGVRAWAWNGTGWGAELPTPNRADGGPDLDGFMWACWIRNNQYVVIYGVDQPIGWTPFDFASEPDRAIPFTSRLTIHPWSPVTGIGPATDTWSWEWMWWITFQWQNDEQRGFGAGDLNVSPDDEYVLFSRETSHYSDLDAPAPNEVNNGQFLPEGYPQDVNGDNFNGNKVGLITVLHVSEDGRFDRRWETNNGTLPNGSVGSDRATAWWHPNYRS